MTSQRTDTISWPGPITVNTYTVSSDAWMVECPTATGVSRWLNDIWEAYGQNNGPFEGYRLDLWSNQRSDSPLLARNGKTEKDRDGLTWPSWTQLQLRMYNYGDANIETQGLLSHEFGHVVWFWARLWASAAGKDVHRLYCKQRGLTFNPDDSSVDEEVWAEDFKYYFGSWACRGSFGFTDIAPPNTVRGIRWFMLGCKSVVSWLENRTYNSLSYQTPDSWGDKGYWIWREGYIWHYTSGDGKFYRHVNGNWQMCQ